MARTDDLRNILTPIVESLDAFVYDLEFEGGSLRLTVDRPGGIDLDTIAEITRQASRQLDLDDPIPGAYMLEVSSPGLERRLRTPEHWASAIGDEVRVKTRPNVDGDRRVDGTVLGIDGSTVAIATANGTRTVDVADIDRARTVFVWETNPKPGGPRPAAARSASTTDHRPAAPASTEERDSE